MRKSGEILKLINFQLIDPLHIPLYRSIESEVILDKGDISGFKEHIDTLKPMIYENQPRSIIKFKHVLLKSLQFMDFPLSTDSIQTFYNDAVKQDELELVARVGIHLIEDCSQAHGAEWNGKKVGSPALGCGCVCPRWGCS